MSGSESELSPTTTTHETSVSCCIPWRRRVPKTVDTRLHVKATDIDDKSRAPGKPNDNAGLITLFNLEIPMTPNLARGDSKYVVEGFFLDSVRNEAYVTDVDGKANVPFSAVLNESFILSGKRKRLMYVGFRYPDGTSLSYVPVRDVILQHRSITMSQSQTLEKGGRRLSAVYGKNYAYLSIPKVVYYVLVQKAEELFSGRDGGAKSVLLDVEMRGERVWLFNTEMRASCKVEGVISGRRYAKTVYQALKKLGGNLEGDTLLYMRFCEDVHSGDPEMKLHTLMPDGPHYLWKEGDL